LDKAFLAESSSAFDKRHFHVPFFFVYKIQYIIRALLQYTSEIQPQAKNGMFCTGVAKTWAGPWTSPWTRSWTTPWTTIFLGFFAILTNFDSN
jgi:hypothetical protein